MLFVYMYVTVSKDVHTHAHIHKVNESYIRLMNEDHTQTFTAEGHANEWMHCIIITTIMGQCNILHIDII